MTTTKRSDPTNRRRATLARRLDDIRRQREAAEQYPHPSEKRHAQRLATLGWHERQLSAQISALEAS